MIIFKPTKECDVFSTGCNIYYAIRGEHPYGKPSERTYKIKHGLADLEPLKRVKFSYFNVIKAMLHMDQSKVLLLLVFALLCLMK